jgi:hypothetical protein
VLAVVENLSLATEVVTSISNKKDKQLLVGSSQRQPLLFNH